MGWVYTHLPGFASCSAGHTAWAILPRRSWLSPFTVHGLASLVITGRVECAQEGTGSVEAVPMPVADAVRASLNSLLDGFRVAGAA